MSTFNNNRASKIEGRYITNQHLETVLETLNPEIFKQTEAGKSVLKQPVYRLDFGTGTFKILLWSQMHGNEATTTKAVIDLLHYINQGNDSEWLTHFSFTFLPVLNPDGAKAYTRNNANDVDLNRDSKTLTQPEAEILRTVIEEIQPDLALNMHDQRTIFSAGGAAHPATLSFLAPSFNENREVNDVRLFAMQLIAKMTSHLKTIIPNQIGRFDDSFNINCIGDMCTSLKIPTILFEAGHFQEDYEREISRDVVFFSLKNLLNTLITQDYKKFTLEDYLKIPENEKNFVDILIENFSTTNDELLKKCKKIPVQLKEVLKNDRVEFFPVIDFESAPDFKYGHRVLNINGLEINSENDFHKIIEKRL
ncbi:MAG TPA: M14 family zinc carboxypeptidase [Flavobacterium sp.]|nr:M14 family zinc carboxypeptidase [Flavobacterium sp.]